MSYEKQTWVNNETPVDADHMNHMEEGIKSLENAENILFKNTESGLPANNVKEAIDVLHPAIIHEINTGEYVGDNFPSWYAGYIAGCGLSLNKSSLLGDIVKVKAKLIFKGTVTFPISVHVRICLTNQTVANVSPSDNNVTSIYETSIQVTENGESVEIPVYVRLSSITTEVFLVQFYTDSARGICIPEAVSNQPQLLSYFFDASNKNTPVFGSATYNRFLELVCSEEYDFAKEKDAVLKENVGLSTSTKNLWNITTQALQSWANPYTGAIQNYPENLQLADYKRNDYAKCKPSQKYIVSSTSSTLVYYSISFYTEDKTFISSVTSFSTGKVLNNIVFTTPLNAAYLILSVSALSVDNIQIEEGEIATPYEENNGEDLAKASKLAINEKNILKVTDDLIDIPENIYAVVGDTLELFYEGIVKATNLDEYVVRCTCSKGKAFERKFVLQATQQMVGDLPITITLYDKTFDLVSSKTFNIKVVPQMTSPSSNKNILCIGDSLTAEGQWVNELYRRLTKTTTVDNIEGLGLSNISFIGKRTTSLGAGYEGQAGVSINYYLSTSTSPFAYNDEIDFEAYCNDLGISTIDEVYILLGWNSYNTLQNNYKASLETFIGLLKEFNSDIKVHLIGVEKPAYNAFGFPVGYGANQLLSYYNFFKYFHSLNKLYSEIASENENVDFVNLASQFDTKYNMPTVSEAVNIRNSTTIVVQSDPIHPALSGYMQIADVVYRHFNATHQ